MKASGLSLSVSFTFCLSCCRISRLLPNVYYPLLASKKTSAHMTFWRVGRMRTVSIQEFIYPWWGKRHRKQKWFWCFSRTWALEAGRVHRNLRGLGSLIKPRQGLWQLVSRSKCRLTWLPQLYCLSVFLWPSAFLTWSRKFLPCVYLTGAYLSLFFFCLS